MIGDKINKAKEEIARLAVKRTLEAVTIEINESRKRNIEDAKEAGHNSGPAFCVTEDDMLLQAIGEIDVDAIVRGC